MSRADVLAVMDRLCILATDKGAGGHEAREARAAVAELVEAAAKLVNRPGIAGLCGDDEIRLRAALARVGGAK